MAAYDEGAGDEPSRADSAPKKASYPGVDSEKILAAIDMKMANAYGGEFDDTINNDRARLIDAYLGTNTNPAPEGRSNVVDRTVFQTLHTVLPSLVRIFAGSSEEVVKYTPLGPDDEQSAEQFTGYLNYIVTQKNPWEQICHDWIFDALQVRNGYCMAYWCEEDRWDRETYEKQSDDQLAILMQDTDVKVIQHSEVEDEELAAMQEQQFKQAMSEYHQQVGMMQQQAAQAQQQPTQPGQPQSQPPQMPPPPQRPPTPMIHTLVIERNVGKGHVVISVLPPEHCIVDGDCPNWMLRDADYFEYREDKLVGDLRAAGLDVPDDIGDDESVRGSNVNQNTPEDRVRNRLGESNFHQDELDGDMRKVTVRTVWIRCAPEDDGIPRLYYCIIVGRDVLYAEPCGRIMVSSLTPQPMPHRHPGMALSESVTDIQNIKTAIKRGGLDNLYLANNGRHVISDAVNVQDFLDSRPGGLVRMTQPGALPAQGHVMPLVHPFAFDSIIGSLEYFDEDSQNRTGASRYFAGTDAGAINKTASGTIALQNQAAGRVEHYARMMAPAFEELFNIVQELVQKHQHKADVVKLREEWVSVDPTTWATRRDCRISVGVGAGNKDAMMAQLNQTFQMQMMAGQMGLPIVQPANVYETMIEMLKLQGFSNPMKFLTDPAKVPPKQPPPPPEIIKTQMQIQADAQKTQATQQFDAQQSSADRQLDWAKTQAAHASSQQLQEMKGSLERTNQALAALQQHHDAHMDRVGMQMDTLDTLNNLVTSHKQLANDQAATQEKTATSSKGLEGSLSKLADAIQGRQVIGVKKSTGTNGKKKYTATHADGTTRDIELQ